MFEPLDFFLIGNVITKFYYTCEQTTSHLSEGVSKVHSHKQCQ